ncbi:MAG: PaaI family thioesterase, partial [Pseudomonadota bacterium]
MPFDPLEFSPPFGQALGFEFLDEQDGELTVRAPYAEHLVGDPDTGVIHGGVLTAMLDNACGRAVHIARIKAGRDSEGAIATLDLRIDYMGPSAPGKDVYAKAACFRLTQNIAFVRARAYNDDPDQPIASCVAAFMLGTPSE